MLAGRLNGTLAGRPVEIAAEANRLQLRLADWRSAIHLRRSAKSLSPVMHQLRQQEVGLTLKIGSRISLEVLPNPSPLVRLFL